MHIALRVPLSFLGLQLAWSGLAWACSCAEDAFLADPAGAAESVDIIFVGVVLDAEEAGSGGCGGSGGGGGTVSSADPVPVAFEVTEALKGTEVGEVFELTTARDGASCGLDAEVGATWLVGLGEGDAEYYLCDPGGELNAGYEEALEEIRDALEG